MDVKIVDELLRGSFVGGWIIKICTYNRIGNHNIYKILACFSFKSGKHGKTKAKYKKLNVYTSVHNKINSK